MDSSKRILATVLAILGLEGLDPERALGAESLVRAGTEFLVNTYTPFQQGAGTVAIHDDGTFIILWQSAFFQGIVGRRYDAAGVAQAQEFQIGGAGAPSLSMSSDGSFVVPWVNGGLSDENPFDIFARRFDPSGIPLQAELLVNSFTLDIQNEPVVAMNAAGDFVVVWHSYGQDGDHGGGVFGQRFDSYGNAQSAEFQVNSFTSGAQRFPKVAMDQDGDFAVVWTSYEASPMRRVLGRRFDASAAAQATEFMIDASTLQQRSPLVAMHPEGDFVVVWGRLLPGDASHDLFGRRFDSAGAPQAAEFQINDHTPKPQYPGALSMNRDGDFVVAWTNNRGGYLGLDVLGRRFDSSGKPSTDEFQVNTSTSDWNYLPAAALQGDGRLVIVWTRAPPPIFPPHFLESDVFAQRFTSDAAFFDIDSDGSVSALGDGLLVLRFLLGFVGSALTDGAVGDGCTRCTAPTLEAHLGTIEGLDIDGDGDASPLTDGLLLLRFLFGLEGSALTGGAVGTECTRCDAGEIASYLNGLT